MDPTNSEQPSSLHSPILFAILSALIPFFILYWFYTTSRTLENKGATAPRFTLLLVPYIFVLILMGILIGVGHSHPNSSNATGDFAPLLLIVFLIGMILVYVSIFTYYYKFAQNVESATRTQLKTLPVFIIILLFAPIAVYLVQDKLNKLEV
jgi:heme/copper-type cytochrome/quinol oxidase subunit 3